MTNLLFFLTPKAMCAYLHDDYTIRQALEKMEAYQYASLPILNRQGEYCGTLTEGDVLWALRNLCDMDMRKAETIRIMEFPHRRDNVAVPVTTSMYDLIDQASEQSVIPVVDDKNTFIGIVTRRSIMKYCQMQLFSSDE